MDNQRLVGAFLPGRGLMIDWECSEGMVNIERPEKKSDGERGNKTGDHHTNVSRKDRPYVEPAVHNGRVHFEL